MREDETMLCCRWRGCLVLVSLWTVFCSFPAAAQIPRGTLQGIVEDASSRPVAQARIHILARDTSLGRDSATDARGEFRIDDLLPGPYQVLVSARSFADVSSSVAILVGTVRNLTVTLYPSPVQEIVNVASRASSIATNPAETTSAVHQAVVTSHDLDTIPLAHRSFANIAYLAPGTEPVEPSDPTKARITAVSFGGSSGLNVELSVDGGDNSDDYIGGFLQNFSPDAIQEFVVRTSQEDADTSRTTGGSVVITTKRGTDGWHGGLAFYERAAALNVRFPIENPAPEPKQPFSRQNYVATLGGPVAKTKLWFFSSFEYIHEDASIAYSPATISQFTQLASLASGGFIPGVPSIAVPANVRVPFHDMLATTRLDWAQSARSQWFLRGASDNYQTANDLIQQATLPSTGATSYSSYLNLLLSEHYVFSMAWLGSFTFGASGLHHTETRNADLGFSLAFPFSSTSRTISGFETFGDNQFVTPITAFPVLRNMQKYQFRYDVTHSTGRHAPSFGVNFIHEPVLSGALANTAETLVIYPQNPDFYAQDPTQFFFSAGCVDQPSAASGITCTFTPAGNGSFSQSVQRLGVYAQDSWRITPRLTLNPGLRYDTTFGLFIASGRSQLSNPTLQALEALPNPLINGAPHDFRAAIAPRLGVVYSPRGLPTTVIRAGIGLFYNDIAQSGWVTAFQAVNGSGGTGSVIDPKYKSPYALHASAGLQHAFNSNWLVSADWTHETGMHGYRRYQYVPGVTISADAPSVSLFRTDNRSSYDALSVHLQGNVSQNFNLIANYTLATAKTWGCVLGELFDYVNGVCNPLHAFSKGDYGPSGEDVRHRFVLAGTFEVPAGFEISTLLQAESARPYTLTTPADVNGFGDATNDRAVVNGVQTGLDAFRGAPYLQVDLRASRPFSFNDRWSLIPFVEFFNLLNRNNPGANFVTNLSALPTPVNDLSNATAFCLNASCTQTQPITSLNQLRVPAGALGDFFGPGTTVGVPLAAQLGVRATF